MNITPKKLEIDMKNDLWKERTDESLRSTRRLNVLDWSSWLTLPTRRTQELDSDGKKKKKKD
jgi:hypothetical protein